MIEIDVNNRQEILSIPDEFIIHLSRQVLTEEGVRAAQISLAITDDAEIRQLNRQYLKHDNPTDVLSFLLEEGDGFLHGEVIVSAETAQSSAADYGWTAQDEMALYIIHGLLHLLGYDDKQPEAERQMRAAEQRHLGRLGIVTTATPNPHSTSETQHWGEQQQ